MSTIDPSSLDEYSATVANKIFASYPDWESWATAEDGVLVIRVPCPIEGRPELAIYTDDQEITLSYDRWHGHFDRWSESDSDHEQLFTDAYAFAQAILSEKVAVAIHMTGSRWSGSRVINGGEEEPEPGPGQTVYVRSWLGTHDSVKHSSDDNVSGPLL